MRLRQNIFALVVLVVFCHQFAPAQTTWLINNTTNIGGFTVTKLGNPQVIGTPYGNAILFNGINEGLIITNNPIAGWTNFTVEMIFRPDPTNTPTAAVPRIFHIAAPNANQIAPDHRLTLEGRITNNLWYADTFIRYSSASNITLIDASKVHPVGVWHQLSVTYDGAVFKQYVNGTHELSGSVLSGALTNGVCSIGMRANTNNFFQGAVLALRFTGRVLGTNEFMCVPKTLLETPVLAGGQVQIDFNLTSGLPLGFTLQQADQPGGPWTPNAGAVLATNTPGISYRFTVATNGAAQFYRLSYP